MKAKISLLVFFCIFQLALSQEGLPTYQDYLTSSWYLIHPSMAGAASSNQIRLTGRSQWFDVQDAPTLATASINGRIRNNIGAGVLAFSDTNGNFSQNGFYATFAYHLNLTSRQLSLNRLIFGASGAIIQQKIDERDLVNPRFNDPAITGNILADTYFDTDFGVSYLNNDFFLHLTIKNALSISKQRFNVFTNAEPESQRRLISTVGYTLGIGSNGFSFEPSFLYLTTPSINEQIVDVNAKIYKDLNGNKFWGGLSYRVNFEGTPITTNNETVEEQRFQTISPFIGVNYRNFVFAYTYTNQLNEVTISNAGFHQITLGYNFGADSYRGAEKRWNCNCPAIND
ncbi:PorP/SprF family type IX secretion system membrane protein [Aquimarina agarivorans]|uniref:PorP/SprF family type IX secretion system membrane protein n=1 Tax=Aquimarina agarivorans TaxID=980584 RepID=UPI000248E620|nr:type IX secretion system membrane protein PorP/SprF [Aquimarina agarivorans]